jgi:hypothetical protein
MSSREKDKQMMPPPLPKARLPKAHLPKANLPKANLPKANWPKANLPKANLPKANWPKANLPMANLPMANWPKANLPKISSRTSNASITLLSLNPPIKPIKPKQVTFFEIQVKQKLMETVRMHSMSYVDPSLHNLQLIQKLLLVAQTL